MENRQFKETLARLNQAQRQAVETLDGPVLVIAGPGTGKTQLISSRAGYILQQTDTPAEAILLLTFTEAGVEAMRRRLQALLGRAVYDIHLSTYHAFGGEIFRRNPDYFEGPELNLIDELSADSLLRSIIAKLPYSNPLKFADSYIDDLKAFISEAKRALLSPEDITKAAKDNLAFIDSFNQSNKEHLNKLSLISKATLPAFEGLLPQFGLTPSTQLPRGVSPLSGYAKAELEASIDYYQQNRKTTQLTRWKRHWLARDERGDLIVDGQRLNERLKAAASIYKLYQQSLKHAQLYDYEDMIIQAIEALEANPELKFSLAERYSYIMLDEFQDTNPAQFRLVQLLSDHPVHEGRPNILAVGDDDQAIYAFQGADHANMADFIRHYRSVKIISLKDNYRSAAPLLTTAKNVAGQIQSRLINELPGIQKDLRPVNNNLQDKLHLSVREFKSDAAQYDWLAKEIKRLIKSGLPASEIAVITPKHRYLAALLPYLAAQRIPTQYERRENIIDEPLVHQLEQMSRLVLAIADGDERLLNHLWPEVLSYDFWKVSTEKIWQISWASSQSKQPWSSLLLNDEQLKNIAIFFIQLGSKLETTTLEQQLDALIGLPGIDKQLRLALRSPLYEYYFAKNNVTDDPQSVSALISSLNILRSRLLDWRRGRLPSSGLRTFVEFIEGHRAAGINILNTSPYHEKTQAVNLLTAYGSKGREFQTVFIASAVDEVWGSASRNQGYRLSLPANLSYIRYQGASEDERLRLLYVAITRARRRLYFTSYSSDLAGKVMNRLKYLNIEHDDGQLWAKVLPAKYQKLLIDDSQYVSLQTSLNYWTDRHRPPFRPKLIDVLKPKLASYQLSPTDLNHFINIVKYGPEAFFMKCLLRLPSAPEVGDSFGTAIHNSLRFAGRILQTEGQLPNEARLDEVFSAQLGRFDLTADEIDNLYQRGRDSLHAWLQQIGPQLRPTDWFEYDFQTEGARLGNLRLTGKLDRIAIDQKRGAICIFDYKTGRPYHKWQPGIIKLHLYKNQLSFYKLLLENSRRFKKYRIEKGVIEFVEPDEQGKINRLEIDYQAELLSDTAQLMHSVWDMVMHLKFPDIGAYPKTLAGIRQFELDLINKSTGA